MDNKTLIDNAIKRLGGLDKEQAREVYKFRRSIKKQDQEKFRQKVTHLRKKLARLVRTKKINPDQATGIWCKFFTKHKRKAHFRNLPWKVLKPRS